MQNIILELYQGNISPEEHYRPKIDEHRKILQERSERCDSFMEKLPEELHLEFIQIYDERSDTLPFELGETFVDGFRLGAQMMLDVLLGGEMKNKA